MFSLRSRWYREFTANGINDNDGGLSFHYDFQNVIVEAARKYGFDDLAPFGMQAYKDYDWESARNFDIEMNRLVAGLAIEHAIKPGWSTVFLPQKTKTSILEQVATLRQSVESLSMDPRTRKRLLGQLDAFERALVARRFELVHLAVLILTLTTIPGGIIETIQTMQSIASLVQGAAADEQERQEAMPIEKPKELTQLPNPARAEGRRPAASAPAFESGGMDDDIPF